VRFSVRAQTWSSHGVIVCAAVALMLIMRRLTRGNFLNSYPFISPDGFDWIFEGVYLSRFLGNGFDATTPALILRAPMFVLITALDAVAGGRGIVVALAVALALLVAGSFLILILQEFGVRWWIRLWTAVIFVVSPFAYFRGWVLSDAIAIAFMHVCVYCLLRYQRTDQPRWLLFAALAMCGGGWTQTYAIIPFLIGAGITGLTRLFSGGRIVALIAITGAGVLLYVGGLAGWYRSIPHEMVPTQFGLLQPSLEMLRFYIGVWLFYFGPLLLVPVCYLLSLRKQALALRVDVIIVLASVAAFVVLLFVYQWPEARFSYFYFGLVLVLVALMLESSVQRLRAPTAIVTLVLVVATSLLVVPQNYWNPAPTELRLQPRNSWLAQYLVGRPLDRFGLQPSCGGTRRFCEASAVPQSYDGYATRILKDYRALMLPAGAER
jgi:hypothetical protein